MEPFRIKVEPQSPEKFDNVGNYDNYLKVDDVNEKILANLKSDTSVIRSFNIIKEEYDIPDDNHMVDEDLNNSDLENQENNSVNSESCHIQWPSKRNGQINREQPNISIFDIFNIASNNNKLNDKVVDANTINNKENISFRKRLTPKFRYFCLHCNEESENLRLYGENAACMKCEKLMVLQCLKCNKQYGSPKSMGYHLQICNVHEKHECEQCDYRTSALVLLKRHKRRIHVKGKEVECTKCNKKFKHLCSLRHHERTYCGKTPDFACTLCSYKTYTKYQLKSHIKAHLNERYFQNTVENNKASADLHNLDDKHRQRQRHLSTSMIQIFYQRYCLKCHKTFENSLVNSNDCKICQTQLSMRCTECNSLHKNLLDITNHLRYGECIFKSKLQCYTCDYNTFYLSYLKAHIQRKHVKIDPENFYKCSKCSRSFKMKTDQTKHVKYCCISDKSYLLCDHCPFRTKSKSGLRNHIMSHMASENSIQVWSKKSTNGKSGRKPFLGFCSKCHTSRKVGKRSKVCLKCKLPLVFPERISVETSIQQALNLHEKKEHDYFECENCGKTFARLSNLDCHMKVCKSRISSGK